MTNPLIRLEFVRRFRSQLASWGIPLMVLVPGIVVFVSYAVLTGIRSTFANGGFSVSELGGGGLAMFIAVCAALVLALMAIVPGMVGASISGERQSQTLQPLQLTLVGPGQIVAGKLIASMAYLSLLLVCCAPALAVPFLMGGTSSVQVIGALVVLLLITVEFAAISLMASSMTRRPATGILLSLMLVGAIVWGPFVIMGMGFSVASAGDINYLPELSRVRFLSSISPVSMGSWLLGSDTDTGGWVTTSFKVLSTAWFLVISIFSLAVARNRVTAPVERDR